jgi:HAD superfamily hydrolase (TIGR01459 family)
MTTISEIASLGDIAGGYDAMLCDVWGVVHDGKTAFAAACAALARFRAERGPVLLLSNAPRPGASVIEMLDELKVPRDSYDGILTSGDATRAEVVRRGHQAFYHLGPPRDRAVWYGLPGAVEAKLPDAAYILCTGLADDEREGPDDYKALLASARERGLPMICANPDIKVHRGTRLIWCAGAVAAAYEAIGGEVTYFGKPHPPIYDQAHTALEGLAGRKLDLSRILAVGDGMHTDILGANRAGIDALLISAGIHAERFGAAPDAPEAKRVASELDGEDLFAVAFLPRLKW